MKIIRKIGHYFVELEIFAVILLLVLNLGPFVIGMKPYVVLSGSMEPAIQTGSIAYVKKGVDASDIQVNDIIAFHINENKFVTHRVVEIDDAQKSFITKGDANENVDFSPIPFENLIGETVFHIPYLGYVMQWLSTVHGKLIFVGICLSQYLIYSLFKDEEEEIKNENE